MTVSKTKSSDTLVSMSEIIEQITNIESRITDELPKFKQEQLQQISIQKSVIEKNKNELKEMISKTTEIRVNLKKLTYVDFSITNITISTSNYTISDAYNAFDKIRKLNNEIIDYNHVISESKNRSQRIKGWIILILFSISGIFYYSWANSNPLKSTNAVSEQSDGIVPEVMSPPVNGQDDTPIVTDNYGTDTHLFSTNALCGGIGQQLNVTASASGNGKTSRDDSGNTITFTPDNTIDCLNDTAWRVAYSPNAHPYIEYTFATPIMVRKIGLIPGYNKVDSKTSTSRWEQNWRVKNATVIIEFVDKTSYTYQLSSLLDSNDMQITNLETDINYRSDIGFTLLANSVRIVIEDAYAPTAANPRNFVAISEVYIEGLTKDK
jgi:hypothetical protein